jgi:hypothetical protein
MNCKNCNKTLYSKNNYCDGCGAKVIRNRLTIKNLFSDFIETYLNYDNTFLQTFFNLFKNPKGVIDGYINGTRKKYVSAISYFTIAITFTGLEYFILKNYFPGFLDLSDITQKGMEAISNTILDKARDYQSFVLLLFVPLYALMAKLVFFNIKKYNYTELLVVFMYIIAHSNIIGSVIIVTSAWLGFRMGQLSPFILTFQLIYSAYCLKQLYNLSLTGIILRTLWFIIVFSIIYVVIIFLFVGILFLTKGTEFLKELMHTKQLASLAQATSSFKNCTSYRFL